MQEGERLPVLIDGAHPLRRQTRGGPRAFGVQREALLKGARLIEGLLFRFRGNGQQERKGRAPGRGDRESPTETRATHTRTKRPCQSFTRAAH
jgi:hypothetical protein